MATHVGVLKEGRLVQFGSPREIYEAPVSIYAATRLGQGLPPRARLATLLLGGMSLAMVFLTATRTAFLTLAVFALLDLATAARPAAAARRPGGHGKRGDPLAARQGDGDEGQGRERCKVSHS